jgi:lipid A disaccharide synthetase
MKASIGQLFLIIDIRDFSANCATWLRQAQPDNPLFYVAKIIMP